MRSVLARRANKSCDGRQPALEDRKIVTVAARFSSLSERPIIPRLVGTSRELVIHFTDSEARIECRIDTSITVRDCVAIIYIAHIPFV
jgi:hypothetical protein